MDIRKNAELKSDADRWTAVTYYVLLQRCVYRTFSRRPVWRMRVGGPGSGPWRCNEAGEPTLERASVIKRAPRHERVIFNRESLFSKISVAPCRQIPPFLRAFSIDILRYFIALDVRNNLINRYDFIILLLNHFQYFTRFFFSKKNLAFKNLICEKWTRKC